MVRPVVWEDHFGTFEMEENHEEDQRHACVFHRSASVIPIRYLKLSLQVKSARIEGRNEQIQKYTWRCQHSSQKLTEQVDKKSQDRKPERC